MWLEKFPVHFLYKIKVSEVFSFLIRNSRVFFKFFGGRNKEANDKMISFCRARRILHPQGYVAIFNFQEKRVSSPNHLFKYILLDLQQNFYWTAIRFLDPRAACTRTAWLVDLPFSKKILIFLQKWSQATTVYLSLHAKKGNQKFFKFKSL